MTEGKEMTGREEKEGEDTSLKEKMGRIPLQILSPFFFLNIIPPLTTSFHSQNGFFYFGQSPARVGLEITCLHEVFFKATGYQSI